MQQITPCPACGMRRYNNGQLPPTFETSLNRQGRGKHLSQEQAMGRVCRFNQKPGCLNEGKPQPIPEPLPEGFLSEEQREELAGELLGEG